VQAGELWVGALLESAEVDDWGKYKFLLLRLRDRAGRQKLLVRGSNYASDAKIVEGLHRQVRWGTAAGAQIFMHCGAAQGMHWPAAAT
jgi:hypothetical protein